MDKCAFHDCTVNGLPLATFGGASLLDYSIGETAVSPKTMQGVNRTTWHMLKNIFGQREIKLTVVFEAEDLRQTKLNRSALNGVLFDKVDLFIPDDGFHYSVICTSTGAEELVGIGTKSAQIKSVYTFTGVRHDDKITVTVSNGSEFWNRSTFPFTDCKLTTTVSADSDLYQFGGAVFSSVAAGDVLVFDGINCKITKNGENYAASVNWLTFPSLVPGWNSVECIDPVTVEFEPSYI